MIKKLLRIPFLFIFITSVITFTNKALAQCTIAIPSTVSVCKNDITSLTAISTSPPILSINWSLLSNGFVVSNSATYFFPTNIIGTVSYVVTANFAAGCVVKDTVAVTVNDLPLSPTITYSPNTLQCANSIINFLTPLQSGVTFKWDFGDGSPLASGANVNHAFNPIPGIGIVSFKVYSIATNAAGCTVRDSQMVNVRQGPDPLLDDFEDNTPFTNCSVTPQNFVLTITNSSTTVATNTSYEILWGDGSPLVTLPTFPIIGLTHTYTTIGFFNLSFKVTDINGCVATKIYTIYNGSNPLGGILSPGSTVSQCIPFDLTFPISGTSLNPPGTLYIISTNDGTPPITLTHPPPPFYTKTFNQTSCGVFGSTIQNAFFIKLRIQNPCGFVESTIEPITTNSKPITNITISPDTIRCVNSVINFLNTSLAGSTVNGNGVCTKANPRKWMISPSTGWNIISGSLGSNILTPNPATWGSNQLNLNFSIIGTYSITLITSNVCGSDTAIKIVCIEPPIIADFNISNLVGCGPQTINFTDNSIIANQCKGVTRLLNISKFSNNCPEDSLDDFRFVGGTNSESLNPTIEFINEGIYKVQLLLTNSCGTDTSLTKIITIKRKPSVSVIIPPIVCKGNTINPISSSLACGEIITSYLWTFPDGTPSSSISPNPGLILFNSTGIKNVSFVVSNSCGTTTINSPITVLPIPIANAGLNKKTCSGDTTSIGSLSSLGVAYSWFPSTGLSSPFTSFTDITLTNNGSTSQVFSYQVTATLSSGCFTIDTVEITIDPLPQLNIQNLPPICQGDTALLIASGADTYVWDADPTLISTSGASVIAVPTITTLYTVTGTNLITGCETKSAITVFVNPLPIVNAGANLIVCNQAIPVNLNGLPSGGIWTGPNVSSSGVFTPSGIDTVILTYSYTNSSGCKNKDELELIVVNPINAVAGLDRRICENTPTIQLNGLPIGGSWSGNIYLGSSGLFTPSQDGIYQAIYSFGSGNCLRTDTLLITVDSLPRLIVNVNKNICTGSTFNYVPAFSALTNSFSWVRLPVLGISNLASNGNGSISESLINTTNLPITVSYFFIMVAPICNYFDTLKITVNPNAKAVINFSNSLGCAPFDLSTKISGANSFPQINNQYEWFANNTPIGTGLNFPGFTLFNQNDSVIIRLVCNSLFGCKSDTQDVKFKTVIEPIPLFQTSVNNGCGPLNVSFINNSISVAGQTFSWNFGNGQTSTSTNPGNIIFQDNPNGKDTIYNVILSATTVCTTKTFIIPITVKASPTPLFALSESFGCSPFEVEFKNLSFGVNNTYFIDYGDGKKDTLFNTGNFNHTYITFKPDTFQVILIAINNCGSDTTRYSVIAIPNNINSNISISGTQLFGCAPHLINIYNISIGSNLHTYDFGDLTSPFISIKNFDTVTHIYNNPGIYTIIFDASNGCSDTTINRTITVFAKPIAVFNLLKTNYCVGDSILFTNQSVGIQNLKWDFDDATTSVKNSLKHAFKSAGEYDVSLIVSTGNPPGVICLDTLTIKITVDLVPIPELEIPLAAEFCGNTKINLSSKNKGQFSSRWISGDFSSPSDFNQNGFNFSHTFVNSGVYNIILFNINNNGCEDSTIYTITIKPTPISLFNPNLSFVCENQTVNFQNSSTFSGLGAVKYVWKVNNQLFNDSIDFTYQFVNSSNLDSVPYKIELISIAGNGCSDTLIQNLILRKLPIASFSLSKLDGCIPFIPTVLNNSQYGDNYKWYLDGVLIANGKQPNIVINDDNKSFRLRLEVSNSGNCTIDTSSIVIKTFPKVEGDITFSSILGCRGQLSIEIINNTQNVQSQIIDFGDGTIVNQAGNLSHLYNKPGTYFFQYVGTNSFGCSDTVKKTIEVAPRIIADYLPNITFGCGNTEVMFTNLSTGAKRFFWDFGDGFYSSEVNPSHIFTPNSQPYRVVLLAIGDFNCEENFAYNINISINPLPVINFTVDEFEKTMPNREFKFFNQGTFIPKSLRWDFGDNNFSTLPNVSHSYQYAGEYIVTLTGIDQNGCSNFTSKVVTLIDQKGKLWVPNAFTPSTGTDRGRIFLPIGYGLATYTLSIFNNNGQLLFETSELTEAGKPAMGWDGKINGDDAQQGVYIWKIEAKFNNGSVWSGMPDSNGKPAKAGTITLLR